MSFLSKFFERSKSVSLDGLTDWHSHILPGVDDGVETLEESLEILAGYEELGIRQVWLTPHIMEDLPNTPAKLRARFEQLCQAYSGPLKLHLAAENMIDNLFLQRLEADDLLPIGPKGDMLLVETSYFNAPMRLFETLDQIKAKGYYPLLAHPERYNYITDFSTYKMLRDRGVRFQLNLLSISGHYGPVARQKARRLLAEGYIDRVGSDLHRIDHLDALGDLKADSETLELLARFR
ncbi:MAG: capsular biosynthesis protein [Muribaculaceae bacterium]|nr:capsular biosynthesis protein [Muribaculaceae bacterium]